MSGGPVNGFGSFGCGVGGGGVGCGVFGVVRVGEEGGCCAVCSRGGCIFPGGIGRGVVGVGGVGCIGDGGGVGMGFGSFDDGGVVLMVVALVLVVVTLFVLFVLLRFWFCGLCCWLW